MITAKKERILYFDLIKLIATLCVFICHFTRSLEADGVAFEYKILPDNVFTVYLGSFGVSLFFIVSGAALMYVYDEKLNVKEYLIKRFKGIYPLFWLTYVFAFFITFYHNGGLNQDIPKYKFIYSILGCDGNALWFGPDFYMVGEWFLSVIVLLYLVFPLLRRGMRRFPYPVMAGSVVIFAVLLKLWDSAMPLECLFLSRLPEFVFGMFFVKVIKKPGILMCGAGAAVLAGAVIFEEHILNVNAVIRTEIIGIAAFCVLSYCLKWLKGNFICLISKYVNRYTYGFFLTHHFVQMLLLEKFAGRFLHRSDILVACILCLAVTIFSTIVLFHLNQRILKSIAGNRNR